MIHIYKNWWALVLAVTLLGTSANLAAQKPDADPSYTVDVFDVGTGLSVLVRGPSWNVLFDGGSNDESNKYNRLLKLIPAAELAHGSHLDYVILSHPHTDHDLLLDDVLDNYSVGEIWDSGAVNQVCSYYQFVKAVEREQGSSNAVYRTAIHTKGDSHMPVFNGHSCFGPSKIDTPKIKFGERLIGAETSHDNPTQVTFDDGAKMTLLYGTDPHASDYRDNDKSYNDFSFVVSFELGSKTVLLMGDAQGGPRATPLDHHDVDHTIEKKLLDCCMDLLPADVMVVGHHGSETSSRNEFLDAVDGRDTRDAPSGATGVNRRTMHYVISAGPRKYSSVQLPDKVVVDDLRGRFDNPDEHVWRTDLHDLACDDKKNNVRPCPTGAFKPCEKRSHGEDRVGATKSGRYGGCDNIRAVITGSKLGVSYWPASFAATLDTVPKVVAAADALMGSDVGMTFKGQLHKTQMTRRTLSSSFIPRGDGPVKIAFFDADSTLRVSRSGSSSASGPTDVVLLPGVATKLRQLERDGFLIAVVSNQGGIPRYVSLDDANRAFQYMIGLLNNAGAIVHYYDFAESKNSLRKPDTGMAELAAKVIVLSTGRDVDWVHSYMVGDSGWKKGETDPKGRPGIDPSNSDRGFAENIAKDHPSFGFHYPEQFFGWDRFGIRRFDNLKQVEKFFEEHGSNAFSE